MKYSKDYIRALLIEKALGRICEEDNRLVEEILEHDPEVHSLWNDIREKLNTKEGREFLAGLDKESVWERIKDRVNPRSRSSGWWAAAAVFLAILVPASIFYKWNATGPGPADTGPGVQLQMHDGKEIDLSAHTGDTVSAGVVRLHPGQKTLEYKVRESEQIQWTTLKVPPKLDYKVVLSDSSEVWLNAASDLRFPLNFSDTCREVYLAGEAYFNITEREDHPFIVRTDQVSIHVTGTAFNVNTYQGNTVTSLVKGSVSARSDAEQIDLKPGYQAVFDPPGRFRVQPFNKNTLLSWMKGIYFFYDSPLQDIAEVLPRWFDVEVVFEDPALRGETFTGAVKKDQPLHIFLNNLETAAGVKADLRQGVLYFK